MLGRQLLRLLLWVPLASAAFRAVQAPPLDLSRHTVLPDDDDFYRPPPGYERAQLGDILRWRAVPNGLTLNNKDAVKPKNAWQIQYRTQTGAGDAEANIVTLLEPYNSNPDKLFVYHWFSDASYSGCNPSVAMQIGTRADNEYTQLQSLVTIGALSQGWWVSVADDTGPNAAYGSGLHTAYATLDSIRAIKNANRILGSSADPIIGTYGYSGGGLSAGWMAEIQPTYAPDVKIVGTALGGIIPNTSALVDSFNKHARASYGPPIIMGLTKDYKNMSDWVLANVKPEQKEHLYRATKQCFDSNFDNYTNMDLGVFFKDGYESLHGALPWGVFKWSGTMGLRGTPKIPLYLYESSADDASPIEYADNLYQKWCAQGSQILYKRNMTPLNHSEEMIAGVGEAIAWVKERLDGKPAAPGCTAINVQKGYLQALTDPTLLGALFDDLGVFMGARIGPVNSPFPFVPAGQGVVGRNGTRRARSTFSLGDMLANVFNPFSGLQNFEPGGATNLVPDLLTALAPGLANYVGGVPKVAPKAPEVPSTPPPIYSNSSVPATLPVSPVSPAAPAPIVPTAPADTSMSGMIGKLLTGIVSVPLGLLNGAVTFMSLPLSIIGGGLLAGPIGLAGSYFGKGDSRQRLVDVDASAAPGQAVYRMEDAPVGVTSRIARRFAA